VTIRRPFDGQTGYADEHPWSWGWRRLDNLPSPRARSPTRTR
jgi:hypothetical protein